MNETNNIDKTDETEIMIQTDGNIINQTLHLKERIRNAEKERNKTYGKDI